MNLENLNDIRNSIDNFRRYESQLFEKIHSQSSTRKDDILKINKQYSKEHKIILKIINDLQNLYEIKNQINDLEKKK